MIVDFLKEIFQKSPSYQKVWPLLLSKIEPHETKVSIFELVSKTKVQKKTIYPILTFGFNFFIKNDIGVVFYLINNDIIITPRENYKLVDIRPKKKKTTPKHNSSPETKKRPKKAIIQPEILDKFDSEITEIIEYLNYKTKKSFSSENINTKNLISDRLIEKFTVEDFKYVIDIKCNQWLDTKDDRYLRPSTLFSPANMENYVNETSKTIIRPDKSITHQTYESANNAKDIIADRYRQNSDTNN